MAFAVETKRLHRMMRDPQVDIDYTDHALDEMRKDKIIQPDVELVLSRASVTDVQPGEMFGPDRWRVSGNDGDGRYIEIIIVVADDNELVIDVITVWHANGACRKKRR